MKSYNLRYFVNDLGSWRLIMRSSGRKYRERWYRLKILLGEWSRKCWRDFVVLLLES